MRSIEIENPNDQPMLFDRLSISSMVPPVYGEVLTSQLNCWDIKLWISTNEIDAGCLQKPPTPILFLPTYTLQKSGTLPSTKKQIQHLSFSPENIGAQYIHLSTPFTPHVTRNDTGSSLANTFPRCVSVSGEFSDRPVRRSASRE